MPRFSYASTFALSLGLVAMAACDPVGLSQPLDAEGQSCVADATVLPGVASRGKLGFSAQDLLSRLEGEHLSPMVWAAGLSDGPTRVEFSTTPGPTDLTVQLRYLGGEVREVVSSPEQSGFTLGGESGCPDYLEVDVEVQLHTTDGALAETLPATVQSWDPRFGRVVVDLPLDTLEGSFAITSVEPANATVRDPSLEIGISALGLSGGMSSIVEVEGDGLVSAGLLPIASWPDSERPCEGSEASAKADGAFGEFSANDALARISALSGAQLVWQGGASTLLEFGVAHAGDPVCFTSIPEDDGLPVGELETRAQLAVSAADGSMQGAFDVDLYAEPNADGSLGDVRVDIYAPYASTVDLETFAELYGIYGIDLSGYDQAGLTFSGVFRADGSAAGALTVLGVIEVDCSDKQPGEGCEGNDVRELAMAQWSSS